MSLAELARWVAAGRTAGLQVAVAGKLTAADLAGVVETGADIAGVRSAVCADGRDGRVSAELVRELVRRLQPAAWSEGVALRAFSHQ